ncbi:MAG: hypothetical protein HQL77_11340 [Magnetococcales bacterium]|nr:hypothetical protein [Magnetococcales bacterium]
MTNLLINLFCILMIFSYPGTGFADPGLIQAQDRAVKLPKISLKPQIKTLAPVVDGDSRYAAGAALLAGQFSQSSWILDESTEKKNRVVTIFSRDMADIGARIVIHTWENWHKGERLTIHRPGEILRYPDGRIVGQLSETVGIAELVEYRNGEWMATVVKIFREIVVGDLADTFYNEKLSIKFKDDSDLPVSAPVLMIDKNLEMAGKGQVIVVGLGMNDRVYPGLVFPVFRDTPVVSSKFPWSLFSEPETERQDEMPIAEVVLFRVASRASLALVIQSEEPVVKGDRVGRASVSSAINHETR